MLNITGVPLRAWKCAFLGNYDRPTNLQTKHPTGPTNQPTNEDEGLQERCTSDKLHFASGKRKPSFKVLIWQGTACPLIFVWSL